MKKFILSLAILAATFTAATARTLRGNKTITMPIVALRTTPEQHPPIFLAYIVISQKEMGSNGRTITISVVQDGKVLHTWQRGGKVFVEYEGTQRYPEHIEIVDNNFRYLYVARDAYYKNFPVLFNFLTDISDSTIY